MLFKKSHNLNVKLVSFKKQQQQIGHNHKKLTLEIKIRDLNLFVFASEAKIVVVLLSLFSLVFWCKCNKFICPLFFVCACTFFFSCSDTLCIKLHLIEIQPTD